VCAAGGGAASGGAFTATLGAAFTSGGLYGFSTGVSFAGVREARTRDSGVRDADTDGSEPRSLVADAGGFSVTAGDAVEFASRDSPALSPEAVSLDAASGAVWFAAALVLGPFASGGAFPAGGAVVSGAVGAATVGADDRDCAGVTACSLVEVLGVTAGAFEEAVGAALSRFVTTVLT
jgi:hypothetical protein